MNQNIIFFVANRVSNYSINVMSRYDQGILDVGMTKEDRVELVKTHSFTRKHATGKAKIELHVLQVNIKDADDNLARQMRK